MHASLCSFTLSCNLHKVFPMYTLPQLQGMVYTTQDLDKHRVPYFEVDNYLQMTEEKKLLEQNLEGQLTDLVLQVHARYPFK